ncbi:MAG: hypothetical protein HONBIEJF_01552 [Fimbriimonadaceae bacterium]|nr:hypothetical protein [Fimbriimonadaceae bacterium]
MSEAEHHFRATYQVVYDAQVAQAVDRAMLRSYRLAWLRYGFKIGVWSLVVTYAYWMIISYFSEVYSLMALGYTTGIALVVTSLDPLWGLIKLNRAPDDHPDRDKVWDCEISDRHWKTTDQFGFTRTYLWHQMEVISEFPEAWWIRVEAFDIIVFRKPLREAGVEDAFRERMAHGK